MEGQQFDQLTRRFATFRTRRGALKSLVGAVVAVVAGLESGSAQACTPHYSPCTGDDKCCSGSVCEYGLCMPGCRIDGAFVTPWSSPPGDICQQCLPEASTVNWTAANEGVSCWSGDPAAGATFCQSGECRATGPASCPPPPPCHTDQLIDAATCTFAVAEAGTLCGGQAMCYGGFYQPADTCDGDGFCIGGGSQIVPCAPYLCGGDACTTACVTDADCASGAHCDDGRCFPDADLGQPCDEDSDCQSGMCINGVCCNQRCEGICETCSAETGGYCSPVICDDGLSCTTGVCDDTTGECLAFIMEGACLIDGVCYASGAYNSEDVCFRCMPDQQADDWTPIGCVSTLPCMRTACKMSSGGEPQECEYLLKPDTCLIDGVCYENGDPKPGSVCEICDRVRDHDDWSIVGCDHSAFCVNGTCATTVTGEITADGPRGMCNRPNNHYVLHKVAHSGGGLNLRTQSNDGVVLPNVEFFTAFDPANPCANKAGSYYVGCFDGAIVSSGNLAAGVYTVVVSGHSSTVGTYTLQIRPDSNC